MLRRAARTLASAAPATVRGLFGQAAVRAGVRARPAAVQRAAPLVGRRALGSTRQTRAGVVSDYMSLAQGVFGGNRNLVIAGGVVVGVYIVYRMFRGGKKAEPKKGVPSAAEYDVIIESDDLRKLTNEGWSVHVNGPSDHLSGVVVSVLGVYNRGKTFLLNKLANTDLPATQRVHTHGLSFKVPRDMPADFFVLLDTAGLEAPVGATDVESMVARRETDMLNSEVAFAMSDVVVLVVSDMTLQDQVFLRSVYQSLQRAPKRFRDVIVVHNFKDVRDVETLKGLIDEQVRKIYPGTEVSEPLSFARTVVKGRKTSASNAERVSWWRYVEPNSDICMRHVVLAQDGSPAGDAVNSKTYELLNKWVSSVGPSSPLGVLERFVQVANQYLAQKGLAVHVSGNARGSEMRLVAEKVEATSVVPAESRLHDSLPAQKADEASA